MKVSIRTDELEITAEDVKEKVVTPYGNGAHVLVPLEWNGRIVKVILLPRRP